MFHASHARRRQASKAAVTSAHLRLPTRTFAVEAGVEDAVDAAEAVVDAAEEADEAAEEADEAAEEADEAAELPLLLLAIAAPTGRIKPPSTPGGDVLEPELAAAAL